MVTFRGERVVENSLYLLEVARKRWVKLTKDGPWPQNLYEMTALVYDSKRDQIILHGGGPDRDEHHFFVTPPRRCPGIDSSSRLDLASVALPTNITVFMERST